jgi:hypothetical protein
VSTRAIITGGAGFIGGLLARRLLSEPIRIGGAPEIAIDELTLVDLVAPRADIAADPRVRSVMGDLQATLPEVGEADVIFHLAGAVSGAAEVDFDLGMRTNIDGTRALLEHARRQRVAPVLREPIAGKPAICPVQPDTPIALSSVRRTLHGIMRAATVNDQTWGSRTAMNLPALSTTPREMAAALDRVGGPGNSALIDWVEDPAIAAIVRSWPAQFVTPRAHRLGLTAAQSFDDIVREYISSN